MLLASMRNSALKRSLMGKFFASERFEVNRCGPRNESIPMLPSVPQAGRENPPTVGLVWAHWLGSGTHPGPGRTMLSPAQPAEEAAGVNQVRNPLASLFTPSASPPEPLLGRQTPTSWSELQSL